MTAFEGQYKEVERYEKNLLPARRSGILRGMFTGISGGLVWLLIFLSYALAFWFGVKLIMDDEEECIKWPMECRHRYDPKALLVVRFCLKEEKQAEIYPHKKNIRVISIDQSLLLLNHV